ncbi:MAG TPA: zinc ribbon domain-containing protein [Ktedonobacterales bacterium]|nr:zinc ribbon domain-containing protein [Ktedonobacterales bacterium]
MEDSIRPATPADRCPACGAPLPSDARSCLSCGSPVIAAAGAPAAAEILTRAPVDEPLLWQPPSADSPPDPSQAPLAPGEQRCQWCGGVSPAEADRCAHCQAAFPDPARDAAMLAEAQRRLTIIEQELDARKRPRRFWSRLA